MITLTKNTQLNTDDFNEFEDGFDEFEDDNNLQVKLNEALLEIDRLNKIISIFNTAQHNIHYIHKSATVLLETIKNHKTPREISEETGINQRVIYNILSVTKQNDRERIRMIVDIHKDLFADVDVDAWFDARYEKKTRNKK